MKHSETRVQVKKLIRASRDKVFDAWTKPELMKKWYAPGEMTVPAATSDLRVGGAYRIEMKGKMRGENADGAVGGEYIRIVPNSLLVFTWSWEGDPSPETLVTVELEDVNGGTEVTITHERFASAETRKKHKYGWMGCLENLASLWRENGQDQ